MADLSSTLQQFTSKREYAEDDIQAAIVHKDSSTSMRSFFKSDEPILDVVDKPGPLYDD